MTTLLQLEHEYTFTPKELQILKTTQRISEVKVQQWFPRLLGPGRGHYEAVENVGAFGPLLEEAIQTGALTIPIKSDVLFWLQSVWNGIHTPMLAQLEFQEGDTCFGPEDVRGMRLRLPDGDIDPGYDD